MAAETSKFSVISIFWGCHNKQGFFYADPVGDFSGSGALNCTPRDTYRTVRAEPEKVACISAWVKVLCDVVKETAPGEFTIIGKIISFSKTLKNTTAIGVVVDIVVELYSEWYKAHHNDCENLVVVSRGSREYEEIVGYWMEKWHY